MRQTRRKRRLPHSVYLAFFSAAAKIVRAARCETLPGGGVFTAAELDRMDEHCERGDEPERFAAWIIERRNAAELALEGLNIGNETIALSEVA
jgi:hypothetical protein